MIEKLAAAIEAKRSQFMECYEAFGVGNRLTTIAHSELTGLEDAFKIVAGESYFDYWCRLHGV